MAEMKPTDWYLANAPFLSVLPRLAGNPVLPANCTRLTKDDLEEVLRISSSRQQQHRHLKTVFQSEIGGPTWTRTRDQPVMSRWL
jgi:hypothetical protein